MYNMLKISAGGAAAHQMLLATVCPVNGRIQLYIAAISGHIAALMRTIMPQAAVAADILADRQPAVRRRINSSFRPPPWRAHRTSASLVQEREDVR